MLFRSLPLSGQRPTYFCVRDEDQGPFARGFKSYLKLGQMDVTEWQASIDDLRAAVTSGSCQAAMILANGTSSGLQQRIDQQLTGESAANTAISSTALDLLFDPATMVGFRAGVLEGRLVDSIWREPAREALLQAT